MKQKENNDVQVSSLKGVDDYYEDIVRRITNARQKISTYLHREYDCVTRGHQNTIFIYALYYYPYYNLINNYAYSEDFYYNRDANELRSELAQYLDGTYGSLYYLIDTYQCKNYQRIIRKCLSIFKIHSDRCRKLVELISESNLYSEYRLMEVYNYITRIWFNNIINIIYTKINNVSRQFYAKFLVYKELNSHLEGENSEDTIRNIVPNFNRLLLTKLKEPDDSYES